jgi:hypothetical protein
VGRIDSFRVGAGSLHRSIYSQSRSQRLASAHVLRVFLLIALVMSASPFIRVSLVENQYGNRRVNELGETHIARSSIRRLLRYNSNPNSPDPDCLKRLLDIDTFMT